MHYARTLFLLLPVAALAAIACKSGDDRAVTKAKPAPNNVARSAAPSASEPLGATQATAPDVKAEEPVGGDAQLMAAMKTVVAACDINVDTMQVGCKAGQDTTLHGMIGSTPPQRSQLGALPTMAVALASDDAKLRTVAAALMGTRFKRAWAKDATRGTVSLSLAYKLLNAAGRLGMPQRRRAVAGVVHALTLAGRTGALIKFLDRNDDVHTKRLGYEASMVYGRMDMFPKIEKLAKSRDKRMVLSAVSAAAKLDTYTRDEKKRVCPWARTMLAADGAEAKDSRIFEQAGYVLARCGGKWINALLDFGEMQLSTHRRFGRGYYLVYRRLCFSKVPGIDSRVANPRQCRRNFKYLETVARNRRVPSAHRALALDAIAYQRRNAASIALMKKYARHKDPAIKKTARAALLMLQKSAGAK